MENGVEVQLKGLLREKARIEALLAADPNWQAYLRQVESFRAHSQADAAGEITLTEEVMAALETNRLFQARCKLVDAISTLEELLARPGTYRPPPYLQRDSQPSKQVEAPVADDAAVAPDPPAPATEPEQEHDAQAPELETAQPDPEPVPEPQPQPGPDVGTDVATLLPLLARAGTGSLLAPIPPEPATDIIDHAANDTEDVEADVADPISPAATLPDQADTDSVPTEAALPTPDMAPDVAPDVAPDMGPDDLTLIRGISLDDAIALEDAGVITFAAIATWTAADVKSITSTFGFGRRIAHEGWIEQAAMLVRNRRTHHAEHLVRRADVAVIQAPAEEAWQRRPLPVPSAPAPEAVSDEAAVAAIEAPVAPPEQVAAADDGDDEVVEATPGPANGPDPVEVVAERQPVHGPLQGPPAPTTEADDMAAIVTVADRPEPSPASEDAVRNAADTTIVPVATNDDGPLPAIDDEPDRPGDGPGDAPADAPAAEPTGGPAMPPAEVVAAADNDTAPETVSPPIPITPAPRQQDTPLPQRESSGEREVPGEVDENVPATAPIVPPAAARLARPANSNTAHDVARSTRAAERPTPVPPEGARERERLALNARIARLEQTISTIVMPDLKRPSPSVIEKSAQRTPPQRPAARSEPAALEPPVARPQLPAPDLPPEPAALTEPVARPRPAELREPVTPPEHDRLREPHQPVEPPHPAVPAEAPVPPEAPLPPEAPVPLAPLPTERETFADAEEADVEIVTRQSASRPALPPPTARDRSDPLRASARDNDAFDPASFEPASAGDETMMEALTRHARIGEEASVEIVQPSPADRMARSRERTGPPSAGATEQGQAPAPPLFRRQTRQPEAPAAPPPEDNARREDAPVPSPVRPPAPQPVKRPVRRHQRFLTALTGEKDDD